MADADFKVRLTGPGGAVVFEASAPLSESRQAEYNGFDITHLPTALISYRKTTARNFSISGKLVSRTADEAAANASILDKIRSWILPDFGSTGAAPPILTLYGYRNRNIDGRRVVIKSYNWSFPDDNVDFIFSGTADQQPMPVIGMLQVDLEEIYSAEEVSQGEWKMKGLSSNAGSFAFGNQEKGDSFDLTDQFGLGRTDPLATQIPSASNLSSVMSALQGGKPTIPGVIAGTIARTLGTAALNSPVVKEITGALPPVLKNIFVGGANVAISEVGKIVTGTVSSVTRSSSAIGFNREAPLPAPGPIGG
jgi:hypothetical protein